MVSISAIKDAPSYGTLRSLEASLNPQLTKYARETEQSISSARKENRIHLFHLCPMQPVSQLCGKYDCIKIKTNKIIFIDLKSLGTSDAFLHTHFKVEPFKEKFGQRFVARCESVNFRLQAPVDGDKGPPGQVFNFLLC